jgi:hypothetical protein
MKIQNVQKFITGIYCIENTVNKKRYIGSSKSIYKRLQKHRSLLRHNKHQNKYLQNSWNKHGEKQFICYVLEICESSKLKYLEQYYIDNSNSEFNLTKQVIRNVLSKDSCKLISETLKRKYNLGKIKPTRMTTINVYDTDSNFIKQFESISKCSKELKINQSSISRVLNKTYSQTKGFIFTYSNDFVPEKIEIDKAGRKKSKNKKSKALKEAYKSGRKRKCNKAIEVYDLENNYIKSYNSIKECKLDLNIPTADIGKVLSSKYTQSKGYKFKLQKL